MVGRYLGAANVLREATGGPLVRAERIDVERAIDRVTDLVAMEGAQADGSANTRTVIAEARAADRTSAP